MLLCAALLLAADDPAPKAAAPAAVALFNGRDATEWTALAIPGSGAVAAADGCLKLGAGAPMTACKYAGPAKLPTADYELTFEARRDEGRDLFACLTFPVGTQRASLVLGGWGGSVCGLSSINGADASENETNRQRQFENGKWYRVRLRVAGRKIAAWIDGEALFEFDAGEVELSTRVEVAGCVPLGFATYRTRASLRKIELRPLPPGK